MNIVKFLCDNIRLDKTKKFNDEEDIIQMILNDLESIMNIDNQEENNDICIDPRENLIKLDLEVIFEEEKFNINIYKQTFKIKNEEIYTLEVTIESCKNNTKLYELKIHMKNVLKNYFKEIYIIKDDENELLCTSLYYKIHKIENLFRSLINNYMLRKYGIGWFKNNIIKKYQNKVVEYSTWYNENYITFRDIKNELFNLQTDDLIEMLQNSYINTLDKSNIEAISKLKNQLGDKADIVIKEEYINLKSIWEEDISLYLPDDFVNIWHEFSKMRNMVAHNKLICKDLEKDICLKVDELNKIMDDFENKINKELKSIEKTNIQEMERQMYYEFECEEAGISPLKDEKDVLYEIYESNDWTSFWEQLEEYLYDYKVIMEELFESLNSCIDELKENGFQEYSIDQIIVKIKLIYEILEFNGIDIGKLRFDIIQNLINSNNLNKVIWDDLLGDLIKLFKISYDKYKKINYSINQDLYAYKRVLFKFKDLTDDYIEITSIGGDVCPEHGTSDDIEIKLSLNSEDLAFGKIEITYGDYEMNFDQGCYMPIIEDELYIDFKELEIEVEKYFNDRIEKARYYYDELEK